MRTPVNEPGPTVETRRSRSDTLSDEASSSFSISGRSAALCVPVRDLALEMGFRVDRQEDTMGAEDFSDYLKLCPGVFIRVCTGGYVAAHNPRFTADPAALWPAAEFFAELAVRRCRALAGD